MPPRGSWSRLALLVALALMATACTQEGGADEPEESRSVTVFGPFRGTSAESFRSSMEPFEAETGVSVRYVGTAGLSEAIEARIEESDLPDIALFPQPGQLEELAAGGWLRPLPESVRAEAEQNLYPAAFDLGLVGDTPFGVMYRANLKSLIWYPPERFSELGYEVPSTLDQLLALIRRMDEDGETPWCIGLEAGTASGWPGTDFIEDLVLRQFGPDVYDEWASGGIAFTEDRIETAFSLLEEMTRGRTLGGSRGAISTRMGRAQDPMFTDPPRCLLHRQASFYLESLPSGTVVGPEGDTDIFVFPGTDPGQPPVVSGGDIAAAFNDNPDTMALMQFLAEPRSGEAWARDGDFLSPHVGFDLETYGTDFDRRVAEIVVASPIVRFDASDQMIPEVGTRSFFEAILYLFRTADVSGALEIAQSGYETD
jgi:alpha-glucoside transport system substrate-binding protein